MNGTVYGIENVKVFIMGAIFNLLMLDYMSYADYAMRAFIGGLVWLIFKVIGDWINYYYSNRKEKKKEAEGQDKTEK